MFYYLWWKRGTSSMARPRPLLNVPISSIRLSDRIQGGKPIGGDRPSAEFLPDTTDWLGRWRLAANESNDWQIDREAQRRNAIYSGIQNLHLQDQAVTESMGPITDHCFEHLAPSDQMVTRTRRRLLMAARALRENGTLPPGVEPTRSAARAADTSSPTTTGPGKRFMPASWPNRCGRRALAAQRSRSINSAEVSYGSSEAASLSVYWSGRPT